MKTFWRLLAESVIIQGTITLVVTGFVCSMAWRGMEVPKEFWTLLGLAWGFYFGGKSAQQIASVERMKNAYELPTSE